MQLQGREVCVENDEYEWEQQRLVKQINHVVVLRNNHILSFCVVRKHAHILEPFQRINCIPKVGRKSKPHPANREHALQD